MVWSPMPTKAFFGVNKMKGYSIITGSITYALKGRDILRAKGFRATVGRVTPSKASSGCGYAIFLDGDIRAALLILQKAGIKILEIV